MLDKEDKVVLVASRKADYVYKGKAATRETAEKNAVNSSASPERGGINPAIHDCSAHMESNLAVLVPHSENKVSPNRKRKRQQ